MKRIKGGLDLENQRKHMETVKKNSKKKYLFRSAQVDFLLLV